MPNTKEAISSKILMTEDDLRRVLSRMAHQVLERHKGVDDLVLAGIPTRGLPIAQRLAQKLLDLEGDAVPVVCLDPRPFRDDRSNHSNGPVKAAPLSAPVAGRKVIIVDDVLFTGRTSRAALDALTHAGRPGLVELAVLVDRGHRELPIRADYVGKNLPTSMSERIQVRLKEVDGVDQVALIRYREE